MIEMQRKPSFQLVVEDSIPVDMIIEAEIDDLSSCEPFQAPMVTLSIDLETSISTNRILCAAVS